MTTQGSENPESSPGDEDPWLETLVASLYSPRRSPLGDELPQFPPEELQRNTTGLAMAATLRPAHAFYCDVRNAADACGFEFSSETKALDFGFGWGRISRVFMESIPVANIYGVDVDDSFVDMTRQLFSSKNFLPCAPFPPLDFADNSFDLVFSYSVFSHLSEDACKSWMEEFARIVKPGGLVAWTTRHESFFDYCAWAKEHSSEVTGYTKALGELFPDIDLARAQYQRGEFVHASSPAVSGGGPRNSSFYGETWIPEAYARKVFCEKFSIVGYYFDYSKYDQACFVFRRND